MLVDNLPQARTLAPEWSLARRYVQTCPVCDAAFSYPFRAGGGVPPPAIAYHRFRPEGLGQTECFGSGLAGVQRGPTVAGAPAE